MTSRSRVGFALGTLLVAGVSCRSTTQTFPGDCNAQTPCTKAETPLCDLSSDIATCKPCPTVASGYRTCNPSHSSCFANEDCLNLGARSACVPRACACDATGETVCDPASPGSTCGPDKKCFASESGGGPTSGRCVPYSCGVCDDQHPCTADAVPFCFRPSTGPSICVPCSSQIQDYHACDPVNPTDCLGDEICKAGAVSFGTLPATGLAVCVPAACRCSVSSACDPKNAGSDCRADETCFDSHALTAPPPQCIAKWCVRCSNQVPCNDPQFPFCKLSDGPVGRCAPCPTNPRDYAPCADSTACPDNEECGSVVPDSPVQVCVPVECGGQVSVDAGAG
jgi:hypothetical protein